MADEEGGTKIGRRPAPQQEQQQQRQQMPQQQVQQQQQQDQYQQQQQQQQPQPGNSVGHHQLKSGLATKSKFGSMGNITFDVKDFKYSLLVMIIFIILNSKMIWKQLIKFPMMGELEPSMLALIVNSIIAGVCFYIIANYIIK